MQAIDPGPAFDRAGTPVGPEALLRAATRSAHDLRTALQPALSTDMADDAMLGVFISTFALLGGAQVFRTELTRCCPDAQVTLVIPDESEANADLTFWMEGRTGRAAMSLLAAVKDAMLKDHARASAGLRAPWATLVRATQAERLQLICEDVTLAELQARLMRGLHGRTLEAHRQTGDAVALRGEQCALLLASGNDPQKLETGRAELMRRYPQLMTRHAHVDRTDDDLNRSASRAARDAEHAAWWQNNRRSDPDAGKKDN